MSRISKLLHACPSPSLGLLVLSLAFVATSSAQGPDVRVELKGQRVVLNDGKESFLAADKAGPGELIQYEATYRNDGKELAKNVAAIVPIPQGMALQADSTTPPAEQASIDGKTFSAVPLMRQVRNEAGVLEIQPVPLPEYRALRWNLTELAPGKTTTVVVRAQILGPSANH